MYKNTVDYKTGSISTEDLSKRALLRQKGHYQLWGSGRYGIVVKIGTEPVFAENYTLTMALYDWNAVTGDSLTSSEAEDLYEQKNHMA